MCFDELTTGKLGISSCYERNGTVYLRLETVARGLGFTEIAASGNECVRWRTVKKYLAELGIHAGVQLPAVGTYTGLIVDCRGMQLHPAMSPVIRDAGGAPIYGYRNLDSAKVIANGMAAYASSEDMAARAGSHPLLVRAVRLDNHNANPGLSVEDANRVLVENRASGFLDHCAVVFLR